MYPNHLYSHLFRLDFEFSSVFFSNLSSFLFLPAVSSFFILLLLFHFFYVLFFSHILYSYPYRYLQLTFNIFSPPPTHIYIYDFLLDFRWFCLSSFYPLLSSILYINLACLSVCLSVCLYAINVKTAEPIGPKFVVGHHVTTGKVYEWSKFQIFVSIKIRSSLDFWKFWKSTNFFVKIRELFLFCFTMYTKRTCSQLI